MKMEMGGWSKSIDPTRVIIKPNTPRNMQPIPNISFFIVITLFKNSA